MKRRDIPITAVCVLVLALVLIGVGTGGGLHMLYRLEQLTRNYGTQSVLMEYVRNMVLSAVLFSAMGMTGICILYMMFLRLIRRSGRLQQEAEELRARNEAMEELNRQTRELAHHQRLETLGTLTSSIAHEFNNLLTPIMGYSMMALEKLPPEEEELYDSILEVYNASCTAKKLISRLSDLSRKNNDGTFHLASMDELIQRSLDVAEPARKDNVEIRLDLNCQEQRIRVNEIQISQLILNLILNAFQAMEEKGGELSIRTAFDEGYVYMYLRDTGCGIPRENRKRIFDPFFTTKESGRGTGLGLAIAAQVAEDHRGSITVDSREGQWTEFTVCLPRES